MSKFREALAGKDFIVTVELDPPRGTAMQPLQDLAASLSGRVEGLVISDNRKAEVRLSALAAALMLGQQKCSIITTLTCRDRNRLALTSDLLAASAAGLEDIIIVSGDFVSLGDHPEAKPVYDLDSVQALQLAGLLAQGRTLSGGPVDGTASFHLGSSVAPAANPLMPQVMKFRKKIRAGAEFFITQPISGIEVIRNFREKADLDGARLLAWVEASGADGFAEAAGLVKALQGSGLVHGVHLSTPDDQARLPELLDKIGR